MSCKGEIRSVRIVACGVFRSVLEHFKRERSCLNITYLPSNLHIHPFELKHFLHKEIVSSRKRNERVICLYGTCFPDIDDICRDHGCEKIVAHHCYELLLGEARFSEIMDENARTYFLERDLIVNFDEYCRKPLELEDGEMRELLFGQYERLIYIRQPSADPGVMLKAKEIADFLDLSLEVRDADYFSLEKKLADLIDSKLNDERENKKEN